MLRLASESETGFDPAKAGDARSARIHSHIFETLLEYDPLARPALLRPKTAQAMPESTPDFKTWTVRVQPGIFFTPDPAFGGRPRELVAADYAYSLRRLADPANKSTGWSSLEQAGISGLLALRREALDQKKPFDYDKPITGLQLLDRYTLRFQLDAGRPRFAQWLVETGTAAVAREVIERHGDASPAHPVGTGPFVLKEWKRSSRVVLERNPQFRERRYDARPAADDAWGQAVLKRLKGQRLPMVDRVEIAIIDEKQPTWLAFLNGEADWVELPDGFLSIAMPNGRLAPHLARRGVQADSEVMPSTYYTMFNMEHPLVGGYEPHKVALRRAISLAVDLDREIRLVRRGQAIPAQGAIGPQTFGYDPKFKSEMSEYNLPRAKALLDMYGYVDRDGDGWRDLPDGKPLLLEYATQPDQQSRQLIEQWKRNMDALKVRIEFKPAKWPENLKSSRAGKLMMWGVGWLAGQPDADTFIAMAYGPNKGQSNHARFDHPEVNRLYEQQRMLPDGPERQALINQARNLIIAYMPYKVHVHRIFTDLTHPWVTGYERNIFVREQWKYVDVDAAAQRAAVGR